MVAFVPKESAMESAAVEFMMKEREELERGTSKNKGGKFVS